MAQTLSADERVRAERFYFEHDRKRFIIGRGLLRTILSRYLDIEPLRLQFCYQSHGKPVLADFGAGKLHFNLSHSQGLVLYAVTGEQGIGIDIEYVRPLPEADQIVKRFFSARESAVFKALPTAQKPQAFFNCWTRKEAYLKAIGDGLACPLDRVEVSLTPGEPPRLLSIAGTPLDHWTLQELTPACSYVGALAVRGQNWHIACWRWS